MLDETLNFLYKTGLSWYNYTKNTILSVNNCIGFAKPIELSATKVRVFYELLIPFLIFVFPFLLFMPFFGEIIMKMTFFSTTLHHFIIFFQCVSGQKIFLHFKDLFFFQLLKTLRFNREYFQIKTHITLILIFSPKY